MGKDGGGGPHVSQDRVRTRIVEPATSTNHEGDALIHALKLATLLTAERDALKKAKSENDERFMIERDEARAERDHYRMALQKIADPRKLGHSEPDYQTRYYCLINVASEALADSEEK